MTAIIHTFEAIKHYTRPALKTVLVGGCFDVLHYGHLNFLSAARKLGNHLIVALEPDEKIMLCKKRLPVHTVQQRAEILAHLRIIEEVIILPMMDSYQEYLDLVMTLKPDYLAITEGDPELNNKKTQAHLASAELVIVNSTIEALSSSRIIMAALD